MFFGGDDPFASFFSDGGGGGGGFGGPGLSRMFDFGGDPGQEEMDVDDEGYGHFGGGHMGGGRPQRKRQDSAVVRELPVSLEDINKGATKKLKITRRVLNNDGRSTRTEDKILTIDIKPGWKAGTKITFPKEGDQTPNNIPADVVFVIKDKPHSVFTREGSDIRYKAKISLKDALCGTTLQIPTIDGRKIPLRLREVVKPHTAKRIQGEGLPIPKQPGKRGDLIIDFDVVFSNQISSTDKEILSDSAVVHELPVSLEDINKGATKKFKITRRVLNNDGRSTRTEDKILTIDIKPGWKAGTKITFPKEGDQTPNNIPADVVFVIKDKPHNVFTREGSNIRYKAKISPKDAFCGTTLQIPTIDGRKIPLLQLEVVKPHTAKRIQGEGLPIPKQPGKRGDLIIDFDVVFSKQAPSGDGTQVPQVSCDGAWQKRGTGQNYDSLSGHVTVVGKYTRKCLGLGLACRSCRKCTYARWNKTQVKNHNCKRNWTGSAKGMEPFLTVKCLKSLKEKGFNVKKLTMDEDTTTFIRAKKAISPELTKSSDKNHVIKNLTSNLYKLRQENKNLSVKIINYFKKCFSYAVQQNRGSPASLQKNLEAIVPHAFGEHVKCDVHWCGFLKAPNLYKHKSLPHGKDLHDEGLRKSLSCVFAKYTANADKLADMDSSNSNENLNQIIAKKAPKSQHYSGSESLAYRLSASVAQKNEGHKYMLEVNKTCNLSPGKHTAERLQKLDVKRNIKRAKQGTVQAKRDRLRAKENRHSAQALEELKEGTTYESGVLINKEEAQLEEEIQEIPLPATDKKRTVVSPAPSSSSSIIVLDLETAQKTILSLKRLCMKII